MLPLSQAAAREAVGGYVARHGLAGRFEGYRVESVAVRADGAVTVAFTARVPMAFVNAVAPDRSVPVVGSPSALVPLR